MKRILLPLVLLALAVTGCKKEQTYNVPAENDILDKSGNLAITAVQGEYPSHKAKDPLRGNYEGIPLRLTNEKTWYLDGIVSITNTSITIEPGTYIVGLNPKTPGKHPGALVITQSGRIYARGTVDSPVVFTSKYLVDGKGSTKASIGDFGGVVILGQASFYQYRNKNTITVGTSNDSLVTYKFGNDWRGYSSGEMKYVRIEYAGGPAQDPQSMAALSCYAVGLATRLRNIECSNSYKEAFRFYGGEVSASYLLAYNYREKAFVAGNGYTGTLSYGAAIPGNVFDEATKYGGTAIYCSSGLYDGGAYISGNERYTYPKFENFTIIGLPATPSGSTPRYFTPFTADYCYFDLKKSITLGYANGLTLPVNLWPSVESGKIKITDNILCGGRFAVAPAQFDSLLKANGNKLSAFASKSNAFAKLTDPFPYDGGVVNINLLPLPTSPVREGTTHLAGAFNEFSVQSAFWGFNKKWMRLDY